MYKKIQPKLTAPKASIQQKPNGKLNLKPKGLRLGGTVDEWDFSWNWHLVAWGNYLEEASYSFHH